jgi:hypothetical protein
MKKTFFFAFGPLVNAQELLEVTRQVRSGQVRSVKFNDLVIDLGT